MTGGTMEQKLDLIMEMLKDMNGKFDQIDGKLSQIDSKFDQIDKRFDSIDTRLDSMDSRFDSILTRLDTMEQDNKNRFEVLANNTARIDERLTSTQNIKKLYSEEALKAVEAV